MSPATVGTAERWDRRRLLATLAAVAATALVALVGLGYAVADTITSMGRSSTPPTQSTAAQQVAALPPGPRRRDAIAAAPMLAVPPQAGRGGTPAALPAPAITIPAAGRVGPAQVPTGYPHTPAGAVGQLAAIEVAVLQRMSIAEVRAIYRAWADPGAPPVATWELTGNVQAFLASRAGRDADRDAAAGDRHPGRRPGQGHRRPGLDPGLRAAARSPPGPRPPRPSPTATANGCAGPPPMATAGG